MGFQTGLAGLNAATKNLDIIGNNIANANTVGAKASRAEFAALVSSAGTGGTIAAARSPYALKKHESGRLWLVAVWSARMGGSDGRVSLAQPPSSAYTGSGARAWPASAELTRPALRLAMVSMYICA